MYQPAHFVERDPEALAALMRESPLATLIRQADGELAADVLPLEVERVGEGWRLLGHVARANPLWKAAGGQPVLTVQGAGVAPFPRKANLTYTPAPNANGTSVVTYHLHDNGGTSPGVDNSADQTFTITVNAVNDLPVVDPVAKAFTVQANMRSVGFTGLLANATSKTVVRLLPPLTITETEIDEAVSRLDAAMTAVAGGAR